MFSDALSTSAAPTPTMSYPLSLIALLCLAGQAWAHEHHTDEIPEGEAISAQPIVPFPASSAPSHADIQTTGYYIMDPHSHPNSLLWRHLPHWNGPRGTFACQSNPDKPNRFLDHSLTVARTSPSPRRTSLNSWILPRPCPRWSPIRP